MSDGLILNGSRAMSNTCTMSDQGRIGTPIMTRSAVLAYSRQSNQSSRPINRTSTVVLNHNGCTCSRQPPGALAPVAPVWLPWHARMQPHTATGHRVRSHPRRNTDQAPWQRHAIADGGRPGTCRRKHHGAEDRGAGRKKHGARRGSRIYNVKTPMGGGGRGPE